MNKQNTHFFRSLMPWTIAIVSILLYFSVCDTQWEKDQNEFKIRTSTLANDFEIQLSSYSNILLAIDSFYRASDFVSYSEFERFTEQFFTLHGGIQSLSFNKIVSQADRNDFEKSIQEMGYPGFTIKEPQPDGSLTTASIRDKYIPIAYVVPYLDNKKAHGYDTIYSQSGDQTPRKLAIERATETGNTSTTGRISIVQDDTNSYGIVLYHPIYSNDSPLEDNKRKQLVGYAAGAFLIPEMVELLQNQTNNKKIDFFLMLQGPNNNADLLYDSRTTDHKEGASLTNLPSNRHVETVPLDIAGLEGSLTFIGQTKLYSKFFNLMAWMVLLVGLTLSYATKLLIKALIDTAAEVDRLVILRTEELEKSNETLKREAYLRDLAEKNIQAAAKQLSERNDELQQFNQIATDRELRMIELKTEINELSEKYEKQIRYELQFDKG